MKCRNCKTEISKSQEVQRGFFSESCKKEYREQKGLWSGLWDVFYVVGEILGAIT